MAVTISATGYVTKQVKDSPLSVTTAIKCVGASQTRLLCVLEYSNISSVILRV
jgi:hypothetical protein